MQIPPGWPPLREPCRELIQAQLRLGRNATAVYQDLLDQHGFAGQYNSVIYSCKRVLALTERIFAQAVGAMEAGGDPGSGQSTAALTQQHAQHPRC